MFCELIKSREIIWRLFLRDFIAGYKQSLLGFLWVIIMPLIMVASFIFLNRSGILNIGKTEIPYPVFALVGLSIWQLFASGLVSCTNSIVTSGGLITKINFPKESLVFSSIAQSLLEFTIRIAFLVIVFIVFNVYPSWKIIFLPLILIPLLLFTLGLGFLFSLLNVVIRDIANFVSLFVTFLLFITPVLYPQPSSRLFVIINKFNLPGILTTSARDIVITGSIPQLTSFIYASTLCLFIFVICWTIFHIVEPIVAEKF